MSVVANAIDTGLILADTADLAGVKPVVSRLRAGERSSLSELTVGATLFRLGLPPSFGVPAGNKIPDLALGFETATTFIEVISPEGAEVIKEFTDRIGEIAASIVAVGSGANIELFLDSPHEVDLTMLIKAVEDSPFSDEVQIVPSIGRLLKRPFSFPPIVSPSIPTVTTGVVRGVARSVVDGTEGALTAIRAHVFDGRAKRLLGAELHHFPKTGPNVLVIDAGNVVGGVQDWSPSISRCLQPTQNTRISAVVLYNAYVIGNPPDVHRAWKVMVNPHAAHPLPERLSQALTTLPQAWPIAEPGFAADCGE